MYFKNSLLQKENTGIQLNVHYTHMLENKRNINQTVVTVVDILPKKYQQNVLI